ncbi:putative tRNA pseudouridine synthase 1-like protein [Chlamydoabsidia padenii]|nr:putative tRNA pseudouridine synthase 1-like protein [Chlamydoabsidia padenii]
MNHQLKNALNGVFSVYKPKQVTSRQVATEIQLYLTKHVWQTDQPWKIKLKDKVKVGIGGILDPMAEGVLVLGLGTGCKQLEGYLKGTKEYITTGQLGKATDTYDAQGKVIRTATTDHINQALLESALNRFRGNILQTPPMYSGIKIQGKRLYNYARQGIDLPSAIEPRPVTLYQAHVDTFDPITKEFILTLETSGGFYVRSLVYDMGEAVNSCAHMTKLTRTRQGRWTLDASLHLLDGESARIDLKNDTKLEMILDSLLQT